MNEGVELKSIFYDGRMRKGANEAFSMQKQKL
jgi:hypothetical protein